MLRRSEILGTFIKQDVEDDQSLFNSGLVSSLFAMELVLFIEKEFGLEIENQDLDLKNFDSINAVAAFIARKQSAN